MFIFGRDLICRSFAAAIGVVRLPRFLLDDLQTVNKSFEVRNRGVSLAGGNQLDYFVDRHDQSFLASS